MPTFKSLRFLVFSSAALAPVLLAHAFLPPAIRALYPVNHSAAASPFRQFDLYQKRQPISRRDAKIMKGGKHYKPLQMVADYAVITDPQFFDVKETKLDDSTAVIGIVVKGQSFAFTKDALVWPSQHIVNMMVDETPIAVAYCSLADCVRVLTRDDAEPIGLQVGGLDVDNRLVVVFDGERYSQLSKALPLEDHDFVVTTLGDWKQRHPNSKIYYQPTWIMPEDSPQGDDGQGGLPALPSEARAPSGREHLGRGQAGQALDRAATAIPVEPTFLFV